MGQGKKNRKKRDNQVENGNGQVRQQDDEAKKLEKEIEEKEDNKLEEYGQVILEDNRKQRKIHLITIIGEVEGHENSSGSSKTTKYDHILPKLAEIGTTTVWTDFWCCSTRPEGTWTRVLPLRK